MQFTEDAVLGLFGLYDEDRGGSLGYYEFVENLIDGFGTTRRAQNGYMSWHLACSNRWEGRDPANRP